MAANDGTIRPWRRRAADVSGSVQAILTAWVGVLLAVGVERILGVSGYVAVAVGALGGLALGMRQGRRRVRRVDDPTVSLGASPWFGLWLAGIAAGVGIDALVGRAVGA